MARRARRRVLALSYGMEASTVETYTFPGTAGGIDGRGGVTGGTGGGDDGGDGGVCGASPGKAGGASGGGGAHVIVPAGHEPPAAEMQARVAPEMNMHGPAPEVQP